MTWGFREGRLEPWGPCEPRVGSDRRAWGAVGMGSQLPWHRPPFLDVNRPPRYPSVACEILTSDVPQINDALGADEALLNRLYGFLQSRSSLNPLLASFFSKVMGVLINRKTDQVLPTRGPGRCAGR